MCSPIVIAVDGLHKGIKLVGIFGLLSKVDDIHGHVVLLQLLSELHQALFVLFERASDENDNPLFLILVLSMLQSELVA